MDTVFDRDLALERAGGNAELANELFGMLIDELPDYRERLDHARRTSDIDQLIFVAHRINGSAIYTGVPALKAAAESLELDLKRGLLNRLDEQVEVLAREIERVMAAAEQTGPLQAALG